MGWFMFGWCPPLLPTPQFKGRLLSPRRRQGAPQQPWVPNPASVPEERGNAQKSFQKGLSLRGQKG